jgi:NADH dehydrogenase (ubiquinone) 1 beta subcomplex subunit 11
MILLREREAAGIFPVDKNFIDPAKLELPSDEELGDTTIVV